MNRDSYPQRDYWGGITPITPTLENDLRRKCTVNPDMYVEAMVYSPSPDNWGWAICRTRPETIVAKGASWLARQPKFTPPDPLSYICSACDNVKGQLADWATKPNLRGAVRNGVVECLNKMSSSLPAYTPPSVPMPVFIPAAKPITSLPVFTPLPPLSTESTGDPLPPLPVAPEDSPSELTPKPSEVKPLLNRTNVGAFVLVFLCLLCTVVIYRILF